MEYTVYCILSIKIIILFFNLMTFCKFRWIIIIRCIVEPQYICYEEHSKFLDCGFSKTSMTLMKHSCEFWTKEE